jgi:hypothetical protein
MLRIAFAAVPSNNAQVRGGEFRRRFFLNARSKAIEIDLEAFETPS